MRPAIKSIARLKREGLATSKLYRGVFLTSEGHGLAAAFAPDIGWCRFAGCGRACRNAARNSTPRGSSIMYQMLRWRLFPVF